MDQRIVNATIAAAKEYNIPPAHALAFIEVESNGKVFAMVEGEEMPLIRWEGHYFWRRLPEALRNEARQQGLAHPRAGGVKNSRSQERRYQMLERAVLFCRENGLNEDTPFECISIGLGQVMGSHWDTLGYESAQQMLAQAHDEYFEADAEDQVEMIFRFLEANHLVDDVQRGDWTTVARGYNGPAYAKNDYHNKMRRAAGRWTRELGAPDVDPSEGNLPTIRQGSKSFVVKHLQEKLVELGYSIGQVDSHFGRKTFSAVVTFQADNGLKPDGIVGRNTWKALETASPVAQPKARSEATVADLRDKGSRNIKHLDKLQGIGLATAGAGGVSTAAIEGVLDEADRWGGLMARANEFMADNMGLMLLGIGVAVIVIPYLLKNIRVEDHRTGKHVGR